MHNKSKSNLITVVNKSGDMELYGVVSIYSICATPNKIFLEGSDGSINNLNYEDISVIYYTELDISSLNIISKLYISNSNTVVLYNEQEGLNVLLNSSAEDTISKSSCSDGANIYITKGCVEDTVGNLDCSEEEDGVYIDCYDDKDFEFDCGYDEYDEDEYDEYDEDEDDDF